MFVLETGANAPFRNFNRYGLGAISGRQCFGRRLLFGFLFHWLHHRVLADTMLWIAIGITGNIQGRDFGTMIENASFSHLFV